MAKYHMQSFESIAQKLLVLARAKVGMQALQLTLSGGLTWPWPENFTGGVEYIRGKLLKISRRYAPRFFRYLQKTHGGLIPPPPATARVNHWAETNFDKDLLKRKFHGLSPISLTQTPSLNSFWDYSFLDTKGCILLKFDSYDLWWLKYWPKRKNHLTTFGYDFDELSFAFSTLVSDAWESS